MLDVPISVVMQTLTTTTTNEGVLKAGQKLRAQSRYLTSTAGVPTQYIVILWGTSFRGFS